MSEGFGDPALAQIMVNVARRRMRAAEERGDAEAELRERGAARP